MRQRPLRADAPASTEASAISDKRSATFYHIAALARSLISLVRRARGGDPDWQPAEVLGYADTMASRIVELCESDDDEWIIDLTDTDIGADFLAEAEPEWLAA